MTFYKVSNNDKLSSKRYQVMQTKSYRKKVAEEVIPQWRKDYEECGKLLSGLRGDDLIRVAMWRQELFKEELQKEEAKARHQAHLEDIHNGRRASEAAAMRRREELNARIEEAKIRMRRSSLPARKTAGFSRTFARAKTAKVCDGGKFISKERFSENYPKSTKGKYFERRKEDKTLMVSKGLEWFKKQRDRKTGEQKEEWEAPKLEWFRGIGKYLSRKAMNKLVHALNGNIFSMHLYSDVIEFAGYREGKRMASYRVLFHETDSYYDCVGQRSGEFYAPRSLVEMELTESVPIEPKRDLASRWSSFKWLELEEGDVVKISEDMFAAFISCGQFCDRFVTPINLDGLSVSNRFDYVRSSGIPKERLRSLVQEASTLESLQVLTVPYQQAVSELHAHPTTSTMSQYERSRHDYLGAAFCRFFGIKDSSDVDMRLKYGYHGVDSQKTPDLTFERFDRRAVIHIVDFKVTIGNEEAVYHDARGKYAGLAAGLSAFIKKSVTVTPVVLNAITGNIKMGVFQKSQVEFMNSDFIKEIVAVQNGIEASPMRALQGVGLTAPSEIWKKIVEEICPKRNDNEYPVSDHMSEDEVHRSTMNCNLGFNDKVALGLDAVPPMPAPAKDLTDFYQLPSIVDVSERKAVTMTWDRNELAVRREHEDKIGGYREEDFRKLEYILEEVSEKWVDSHTRYFEDLCFSLERARKFRREDGKRVKRGTIKFDYGVYFFEIQAGRGLTDNKLVTVRFGIRQDLLPPGFDRSYNMKGEMAITNELSVSLAQIDQIMRAGIVYKACRVKNSTLEFSAMSFLTCIMSRNDSSTRLQDIRYILGAITGIEGKGVDFIRDYFAKQCRSKFCSAVMFMARRWLVRSLSSDNKSEMIGLMFKSFVEGRTSFTVKLPGFFGSSDQVTPNELIQMIYLGNLLSKEIANKRHKIQGMLEKQVECEMKWSEERTYDVSIAECIKSPTMFQYCGSAIRSMTRAYFENRDNSVQLKDFFKSIHDPAMDYFKTTSSVTSLDKTDKLSKTTLFDNLSKKAAEVSWWMFNISKQASGDFVASLFPKDQIGAAREILIQNIIYRSRMWLLETWSRSLCKTSEMEMLVNPNKEIIQTVTVQEAREQASTMIRNGRISVFMSENRDATRWSPGMNLDAFHNYVEEMPIGENLKSQLNDVIQMNKTKYVLPDTETVKFMITKTGRWDDQSLISKWASILGELSKPRSSHSSDGPENEIYNKWLNDGYITLTVGGGQGVMHYFSSFFHCVLEESFDRLAAKACEKFGVEIHLSRTLLSSDDKTIMRLLSSSSLRKTISMSTTLYLLNDAYSTLVNIHGNKKKSFGSTMISEFNSLFVVGRTPYYAWIKDAYTLARPTDYTYPRQGVSDNIGNLRRMMDHGFTVTEVQKLAAYKNEEFLRQTGLSLSELKDLLGENLPSSTGLIDLDLLPVQCYYGVDTENVIPSIRDFNERMNTDANEEMNMLVLKKSRRIKVSHWSWTSRSGKISKELMEDYRFRSLTSSDFKTYVHGRSSGSRQVSALKEYLTSLPENEEYNHLKTIHTLMRTAGYTTQPVWYDGTKYNNLMTLLGKIKNSDVGHKIVWSPEFSSAVETNLKFLEDCREGRVDRTVKIPNKRAYLINISYHDRPIRNMDVLRRGVTSERDWDYAIQIFIENFMEENGIAGSAHDFLEKVKTDSEFAGKFFRNARSTFLRYKDIRIRTMSSKGTVSSRGPENLRLLFAENYMQNYVYHDVSDFGDKEVASMLKALETGRLFVRGPVEISHVDMNDSSWAIAYSMSLLGPSATRAQFAGTRFLRNSEYGLLMHGFEFLVYELKGSKGRCWVGSNYTDISEEFERACHYEVMSWGKVSFQGTVNSMSPMGVSYENNCKRLSVSFTKNSGKMNAVVDILGIGKFNLAEVGADTVLKATNLANEYKLERDWYNTLESSCIEFTVPRWGKSRIDDEVPETDDLDDLLNYFSGDMNNDELPGDDTFLEHALNVVDMLDNINQKVGADLDKTTLRTEIYKGLVRLFDDYILIDDAHRSFQLEGGQKVSAQFYGCLSMFCYINFLRKKVPGLTMNAKLIELICEAYRLIIPAGITLKHIPSFDPSSVFKKRTSGGGDRKSAMDRLGLGMRIYIQDKDGIFKPTQVEEVKGEVTSKEVTINPETLEEIKRVSIRGILSQKVKKIFKEARAGLREIRKSETKIQPATRRKSDMKEFLRQISKKVSNDRLKDRREAERFEEDQAEIVLMHQEKETFVLDRPLREWKHEDVTAGVFGNISWTGSIRHLTKVDVPGDGYCGAHALKELLNHAGKEYTFIDVLSRCREQSGREDWFYTEDLMKVAETIGVSYIMGSKDEAVVHGKGSLIGAIWCDGVHYTPYVSEHNVVPEVVFESSSSSSSATSMVYTALYSCGLIEEDVFLRPKEDLFEECNCDMIDGCHFKSIHYLCNKGVVDGCKVAIPKIKKKGTFPSERMIESVELVCSWPTRKYETYDVNHEPFTYTLEGGSRELPGVFELFFDQDFYDRDTEGSESRLWRDILERFCMRAVLEETGPKSSYIIDAEKESERIVEHERYRLEQDCKEVKLNWRLNRVEKTEDHDRFVKEAMRVVKDHKGELRYFPMNPRLKETEEFRKNVVEAGGLRVLSKTIGAFSGLIGRQKSKEKLDREKAKYIPYLENLYRAVREDIGEGVELEAEGDLAEFLEEFEEENDFSTPEFEEGKKMTYVDLESVSCFESGGRRIYRFKEKNVRNPKATNKVGLGTFEYLDELGMVNFARDLADLK